MLFAFNTKILLCADSFGDLESLDDKSTCTAAWPQNRDYTEGQLSHFPWSCMWARLKVQNEFK